MSSRIAMVVVVMSLLTGCGDGTSQKAEKAKAKPVDFKSADDIVFENVPDWGMAELKEMVDEDTAFSSLLRFDVKMNPGRTTCTYFLGFPMNKVIFDNYGTSNKDEPVAVRIRFGENLDDSRDVLNWLTYRHLYKWTVEKISAGLLDVTHIFYVSFYETSGDSFALQFTQMGTGSPSPSTTLTYKIGGKQNVEQVRIRTNQIMYLFQPDSMIRKTFIKK